MATLDDVARLAAALPEVTEGERHGGRTWLVRGKVFAWERAFSKADLKRFGSETPPAYPILAARTEDLGDKASVLAENRPGFFTIPHFDNYPATLIELAATTDDALRTALTDAWLAVAPAPLARTYTDDS